MKFDNVDLPLKTLAPAYRTFVEIFRQHFGEDNVSAILDAEGLKLAKEKNVENIEDLSNITNIKVIVRFPQAIVENEKGEKETIFDLFVRISPYRGETIMAIRTTFTEKQILSRYVHSHLLRLGEYPEWSSWCLGGGPIRHTLQKLNGNHSEPGLIGLLCLELKTLVETESLRGGPYIKMSEIHGGISNKEYFNLNRSADTFPINNLVFKSSVLRDWFKKFLCSGKIKLKIVNNKIMLADSLLNILIDTTNDLLKYIEKNNIPISQFLFRRGETYEKVFFEYTLQDGDLCSVTRGSYSTEELLKNVGMPLLAFKGREYNMAIINIKEDKEKNHTIWLFDPHKVFFFIVAYINYLNEKYLESINE